MFAVMACDRMEDARDVHPIYIDVCAEDEALEAETKTPYLATTPSSSVPLEAKVLVSTTGYEYPIIEGQDGENGPIAVHTTAKFTSGSSQLLNGALYNGDENKQPMVYFSALHPQEGWNISGTSGNKDFKAYFTFDGSHDVMFAPQTQGKYSPSNIEESEKIVPSLAFKHLLTYIKLSIYAEAEEVADAWGDIKSIKIMNSADMGPGSQEIIVDLSKVYGPDAVSFVTKEGYKSPFYRTGTNTVFADETNKYSLTHPTAVETAYALIAPVIAKARDDVDKNMKIPEFRIEITSENRSASVDVDLMKNSSEYLNESTMGKMFTITLRFTMGNNVTAQAKVTSWKTGGSGVGDFFETETSN